MASKQIYPCFQCRKAGYELPVYLDRKDEQGRTKYLNEDGTKHVHKTQDQRSNSSKSSSNISSFQVSDESVDRGISAFTMMTDLIRLVEQTQKLLVSMDSKLERLLNLAERK